MSKVSLVKITIPADIDECDVTDAVSEAWPIGSKVEVTWEGQEITHYSTDALIGYSPDETETLTILAHKLRNEYGNKVRFLVLSSDAEWSTGFQYVAIEATSDGSTITAYGAHFTKVPATVQEARDVAHVIALTMDAAETNRLAWGSAPF